jgi:hypothetical protein
VTKGYIRSVLSTKTQRQRFFYVRNLIAFLCAVATFQFFGGAIGGGLAAVALLLSYITVAPVIAFIICLIEQLGS